MKTGNYLGAINVCEICNRKRSAGNHAACAKARQAMHAASNAARRKKK